MRAVVVNSMTRRHDPRRAKAHRTYDSAEIAELYKVTVATARRWRHEGLKPIDDGWPYIFAGRDLAEFIRRRNKPYQPLAPGQIYCVACKIPRVPAGNQAVLRGCGENCWHMTGTCPACQHEIRVRIRLDRLAEKAGALEVRYEDGTIALSGSAERPRTDRSRGLEI